MSQPDASPTDLLQRSVQSGRIHSAYLLTGVPPDPGEAALRFARALVCNASQARPCENCSACQRSQLKELISLDGDGKKGPMFRHVGDHPDLFWVERGATSTRIKISQIRAVQKALRLHANEGGYRVAIIDQAQHLNAASQNALLHLLEEPPPKTTLLLIADAATSQLGPQVSR
jgi:DNA polymerase-3 subunit delta'